MTTTANNNNGTINTAICNESIFNLLQSNIVLTAIPVLMKLLADSSFFKDTISGFIDPNNAILNAVVYGVLVMLGYVLYEKLVLCKK